MMNSAKSKIKRIILIVLAIPVLFILILIVNFVIFQVNATQISQGKPIAQQDSVRQALLVIDIQEATTGRHSDYEYYQRKADKLIDTINMLADSSARRQIPVIYVKSEIRNFLVNILNDMYAPDNPGSKLDARLKVVSDKIVIKDKSDSFTNPALDSLLIKNKIGKLVFTGLDLGHCVNSTILAAQNRKYDIDVISDAVLAKSDSLHNVQLNALAQDGVEVVSSADYLKSLHN